MNSLLLPLLLSSIFFSSLSDVPLWEKMERLAWKNRVVVLYAPSADSKEFRHQKELLATQSAGLKERDLVVIECVGTSLSKGDKNYLTRHFDHDAAIFGVWLVGKDSGTKLSSTSPVPAEKLFGLIDSMPMRQAEMKRDGK